MEKAEENRRNGCFSSYLLHKVINGKRNYEFDVNVGGEDEIELSLGLSLNGRFGVDPKREKRLKRSYSSITNFVFSSGDNNNNNNCNGNEIQFGDAIYAPLNRTCSLPTETEEEWRKRKELQSLRRLEAKRKRLEKMKNVVRVGVKENEENGNCYSNGETGGNILQSSGGSLGSQGSGSAGSSAISEFESRQPIQGPIDNTEARPPASGQSPEHEQKRTVATAPETTNGKSPASYGTNAKETKEMFKNLLLKMPCVSTRGDGPNGKKIEGFLYGYKKGEEVMIVCVCHGDFLSPAEFVKHAGGGDVLHPLKHIVINPSPLL